MFYQSSLLRSDSTSLEVQLIYVKLIVVLMQTVSVNSHVLLCWLAWVNLFVRYSNGLRVITWSAYHLEKTEYEHACWHVRKQSYRNQSENGILS